MGRLPRGRLLALFARGPDGRPRVAELERRAAAEAGVFHVQVPEAYRWFDGHFDQYPLLPAAVQLRELVVPCARQAGLLTGAVARFERLKFSQRIVPGMEVEVRVHPSKKSGVEFELVHEGRVLTSGRLIPAEEGAS